MTAQAALTRRLSRLPRRGRRACAAGEAGGRAAPPRAAGAVRIAAGLALAAQPFLPMATGRAQAPPAPEPGQAALPALSASVTPYVWLPAMRGSVQTPLPGNGDRDFDLSSAAVLSGLSTVPVMVAGELRHGRALLVADLFHAGLTADIRTPRDLLFEGGHVRALTTFATILGMARAVETEGQSLDLGAGARIWSFRNKVSLDPGLAPGVIQKSSIGWADPLVAARYRATLSPSFGLTVYGDVGGFGAGARLTWQVSGAAEVRVTPATTLSAGWRYLSVDKSRGSVGVDLSFNGPFLAASFRF